MILQTCLCRSYLGCNHRIFTRSCSVFRLRAGAVVLPRRALGRAQNVTRGLPDNSDEDLGGRGEELRLQKKKKMRRQLQIYTPPLDHCTSLKPEAASSGSVSVPAHTGCTRPPHADLSPLSFWMSFPARRDGSWWDLRMYVRKFIFGGKRTCNSSEGKERLSSPPRLASQTTQRRRFRGRMAESVMDVHLYIVSKYTSVSQAFHSAGYYILWLFYLTLSWRCSLWYTLLFVVCRCLGFHVNFKVTVAFKG